jgi:hypothetical protein
MTFAFAAAAFFLAGPPRFLGPPEKKPAEGGPAALSPGDAAPFFSGPVQNPDTAGLNRFDLAQLVGRRAAGRSPVKAVLVSLFSSSSKSSRKELVALEALYTQYKQRGLMVVSLATDPARLLHAHRVSYPVVEDSDGAIARRYLGPNPQFPAAVIIDRYDKVVSLKQGYRTEPAALFRTEIESALR